MKPGKYRIGIRTHSEQDTVLSNEITVVKSSVEPATVTLSNPAISEVSGYYIKFRVGEGGSLDRTTSRITMVFPKGTQFPDSISASLVKLNGRPLSVDPQVHQPSGTISLITPIDIENLGEVSIDISSKAGIINTSAKGDQYVEIKTDFEPDPIKSKPFQIVRAGQKPQVIPPFTGQFASYKFSVDFPKTLNANDMIEILFPKEVTLPQFIKADAVLINGQACTLRPGIIGEERKVRVYAPTEIKPGSIMIEFTKDAKIKNPENPGTYQIKFSGQGVDGVFTTDPFDISIKKLTIDRIKITPVNAKEVASWELGGSLAYGTPLDAGDTITLTFPEGTIIPSALDGCVTLGGSPTKATGSGNVLSIEVPQKIDSGADFNIIISKDCGVKNPPTSSDTNIIKISTSKDPSGGVSEAFFIAPSLPVSTLLIVKPNGTDADGKTIWVDMKPDGEDGWFKTPPSIDFIVDSPTAKVKIWWNNATEKSIDWLIGQKLPIADQQRLDVLHWQAIDSYGNEPVRSFEFKIDTLSPTLTVTDPASKKKLTKTGKFTITGLADPSELLKYDDKTKSPYVVPGIFMKCDNVFDTQKVEVVQPKVLEMTENGAVLNSDAGVFKKDIVLPTEGVYAIKIWAEDQAGWQSSVITLEVTYDVTAPDVKMIYPVYGDIIPVGTEIEAKFESEITSTLYVGENKQIATLTQQLDDKRAIFSAYIKPTKKGENIIEVTASDASSNSKIFKFSIWATMELNLWIGQPTMIVNGTERVILLSSQIPVNSFPKPKNPKKDPDYTELNPNTYMAIRPVAERLFAKDIVYDNNTKKLTITQIVAGGNKRVIEMTVGRGNTTALVDGKKVSMSPTGKLYAINYNGSVLVPLRFVATALGAEVGYLQSEKKITITYPPQPK